MMTRTIVALIATGLGLATAVHAGEVYRQTDDSGRVIYSDRPASANATRLDIESRPTDPARLADMAAQREEREKAREEARETSEEARLRQQDRQAQRASNCEKAMAYQQRVETARRLYRLDDNGERQYYSAEEHDAALARARAQVAEWCDN